MQGENREKPLVYVEISSLEGGWHGISSEKLKIFIETYGVNFRDDDGVDLLYMMCNMTKEQIDIVFEYDFDPRFTSKSNPKQRLIRLDHQYALAPYILKKFLETKYAVLFLTDKIHVYDGKLGLVEMYYIDLLKAYQKHKLKHIDELLLLMENFEKRYYTLFDMLLPMIQNNIKSNKKSRVY